MAYKFPINIPPKWVFGYQPPSTPVIRQDNEDKSVSRLRISTIPSQGQFSAEWDGICAVECDRIWEFWAKVENFDGFELPSNFFRCCTPKRMADRYRKVSPSGLYLFAEEPTEERLNSGLFMIQATFLGVID